MSQTYSCRAIGTLVSVAFGFLIIGTIIALATNKEECGSYNGVECHRNRYICGSSQECYCRGYGHNPDNWMCKEAERQTNGTAQVFVALFSLLFWGFVIASIVMCVCRCIHAEDYERVPEVIVVSADAFPQGGKL